MAAEAATQTTIGYPKFEKWRQISSLNLGSVAQDNWLAWVAAFAAMTEWVLWARSQWNSYALAARDQL